MDKNFVLNLVMAEAECALDTFLKQRNYKLDFIDLFPIFKDVIISMCYMHSNCLAHRDIKP